MTANAFNDGDIIHWLLIDYTKNYISKNVDKNDTNFNIWVNKIYVLIIVYDNLFIFHWNKCFSKCELFSLEW